MKDLLMRNNSGTRSFLVRALALLLIALIAAPQLLLAAVEPQLPNPGDTGVSRQQQEQIGQKAVAEVYKQFPVLPDSSPVTQYVSQLGHKLQAVIPQQYSWPYQFHVVQEKDINAFALPGGPVFVNVGTINAADSEAQLAGVMAHEMAHVYMQHSIKQQKKDTLPSLLGGLAAAAAGMVGGTVGVLGQLGAQVGAGYFIMKYSRADEAQADAVGAMIMYKAGYNPQAMAQFFQKLEEESGGSGGPQFLSDHPNPGNRYAAITKEIRDWPPKQWTTTSSRFQTAKADASKVRVYTAQEIQQRAKSGGGWNNQGPQQTSSNQEVGGSMSPLPVSVSNNYRTLQHAAFTMQYPDNWQVVGDRQSAVTLAPEGGVSQSAIAYGVMIDAAQIPSQNASLDEATNQLINGIKQQNPGLRTLGSPQKITVNGVQGRSVDLMGTSPVQGSNGQPLQERDWLVTLPLQDGSLLYVVFIAPDRDFSKLRPAFEHMLKSLRLEQS